MQLRRERHGDEVLLVVVAPDVVVRTAALELGFRERGPDAVRRFPADAGRLDEALTRFERHAEELFLQTAGLRPVPWQAALRELADCVEGSGLDWWLVGSAALAVRGAPVEPRDLDLVLDAEGAARLGELLEDLLVEPVVATSGWIADAFGRAFAGARVEWVGGVHAGVEQHGPCDFGPSAAARRERVVWEGRELLVPPLDLQIAVSERRGLAERAAAARALA